MIKNIILLLVLILNAKVATSQPGFFGHKSIVEGQLVFAPVTVVRGSAGVTKKFGVNYERATSDRNSWLFSFDMGSATLGDYALDFHNDFIYLVGGVDPSSQSYDYRLLPEGSFTFNFQEIGVQKRWYYTNKGSVAPYGKFLGIDANIANCKITNDDVKFYSSETYDLVTFKEETPFNHNALAFSLVYGNRRIFAEHISLGYNVSIGHVFYQTSKGSLAFGAQLENYMEWQEAVMMRQFNNTKLFQLSLNLGFVW